MKYVNIALIILILLVGLGVGYLTLSQSKAPVESSAPSPTPLSITNQTTPTPVIETTPTPSASSKPLEIKSVAMFDSKSNIDAPTQKEITKKVIDPFLDYYRDQYNAGYVKTLVIENNTGASSQTYPYKGSYTFEGGVNGGFLIMKKDSGVDWWYPECLNGCNYSASFKAKYPEIVAKTG